MHRAYAETRLESSNKCMGTRCSMLPYRTFQTLIMFSAASSCWQHLINSSKFKSKDSNPNLSSHRLLSLYFCSSGVLNIYRAQQKSKAESGDPQSSRMVRQGREKLLRRRHFGSKWQK